MFSIKVRSIFRLVARVTRFGEFSPDGRFVDLDNQKKIAEEPAFLDYLIQRLSLCIYFDKKWVGLHFGRIFLQTHLVTLLVAKADRCGFQIFLKLVSSGRRLLPGKAGLPDDF
jgi:hypothetical protein